MKKPSLEIEHLSFSYPEQAEQALDNLSLTVPKGESVSYTHLTLPTKRIV